MPSNVSKMVLIPKGTFMRGGRDLSNGPPYRAEVAEFFLDVTEVTAEQYRLCVQVGSCKAQSTVSKAAHFTTTPLISGAVHFTDSRLNRMAGSVFCNLKNLSADQHPMNCVDFFEATNYCAWVGKRLPTEEEWEYAVRGQESVEYPWGKNPNKKQLCYGNIKDTCPAGGADDELRGVRGLGGNVSEWVNGWYCGTGYLGFCQETERVFRGASFYEIEGFYLAANHRRSAAPQARAPWIGFRCAKSRLPPAGPSMPSGGTVPKELRPTTAPKPNPEMKPIPTGTFMMGSAEYDPEYDPVRNPLEEPAHQITVSAFQIDKTEVTVATYAACVEAGVCYKTPTGRGCNLGRNGYENHPINCVTFYQAEALCKWLGRRLPKQAEWEYAARGRESLKHPWGDDPPGAAVCWKRGAKSGTCAVGTNAMDQTPAGVMDLAGNVSEWIDDKGCGTGAQYNRGAAYHDTDPKKLRASRRFCEAVASDSYQGGFYPDVGFRCAK